MVCEVVERWNPHSRTRHDLFNMFDIVCLDGGCIQGIQATSSSNHASRVKKLLNNELLRLWIGSGGRALVVSWGKKRGRWAARVEPVTYGS